MTVCHVSIHHLAVVRFDLIFNSSLNKKWYNILWFRWVSPGQVGRRHVSCISLMLKSLSAEGSKSWTQLPVRKSRSTSRTRFYISWVKLFYSRYIKPIVAKSGMRQYYRQTTVVYLITVLGSVESGDNGTELLENHHNLSPWNKRWNQEWYEQ